MSGEGEPEGPSSRPKSTTIMSGEKEPEGPFSKEEGLKKSFFNLTKMVKVLYEERNTRMVGESSKLSHGEGISKDKRNEKDVVLPSLQKKKENSINKLLSIIFI